MTSMYQQQILDHAKHPRHFGELPDAQFRAEVANPLCGDKLLFSLNLAADGTIGAIAFTGEGCAISKAAASMVAEFSLHQPAKHIRAMVLDDVLKLLAVSINPARLKCASLGLETLQRALGEQGK